MNAHTTEAVICLKDDLELEYVICEIEYSVWKSGEFEYRFRPKYSVIDLLGPELFQGIPGIDLEKRKPEYVRKNITPTFISERTPSNNREELWKILEDCNMKYLNQLEWLIKTNTKYIGDRLYVREKASQEDSPVISNKMKRSFDIQKRLLEYICAGKSFSYEGFKVDDSNRAVCYNLLRRLFCKEAERLKKLQADGIEKAKASGKYQGRKTIQIDELAFNDIVARYNRKQISAKEAAKKLGISPSTFFRRIKE